MNDYKDLIAELRGTESRSKRALLDRAADAIEALSRPRIPTCMGYDARALILLAEACHRNGIEESEMRGFLQNIDLIYRWVAQAYQEAMDRALKQTLEEFHAAASTT